MLRDLLLILITLLVSVSCNTEKAIFTAPDSVILPEDASIDNLYLTSLNPKQSTVRTYLNASFPTSTTLKGSQTWMLLEGLTPGQRYEVRLCWLATQPTSFWLHTHEISKAMQSVDLISPLSAYAYERHEALNDADVGRLQTRRFKARTQSAESSSLFLQIYAAADYFSLNNMLMETVPPVLVDIILDPYILNILPQSLVPTVCYIAVVAITAWFLSAWAFSCLYRILHMDRGSQATTFLKKRE